MHGPQRALVGHVRLALLPPDQLHQARLALGGMEGHARRLVHNHTACGEGRGRRGRQGRLAAAAAAQ